jgi:hypothetical protein
MNRVICTECETVKHCIQHGCIPKVPVKVPENLQAKPVVYFLGQPFFFMWNSLDEVARLPFVINHPLLGKCSEVRTSKVLAKFPDGSFETRNTIYKPLASKGMGS